MPKTDHPCPRTCLRPLKWCQPAVGPTALMKASGSTRLSTTRLTRCRKNPVLRPRSIRSGGSTSNSTSRLSQPVDNRPASRDVHAGCSVHRGTGCCHTLAGSAFDLVVGHRGLIPLTAPGVHPPWIDHDEPLPHMRAEPLWSSTQPVAPGQAKLRTRRRDCRAQLYRSRGRRWPTGKRGCVCPTN
jgi:hypothetical protein